MKNNDLGQTPVKPTYEELIQMLVNMVHQDMSISEKYKDEKEGKWRFSGFIGAYAETLRALGSLGIMEIKESGSRGIYGRFKSEIALTDD